MKILFISTKYDYGRPERGFSWEYYNLWDSLVNMYHEKHEIKYFPYDEVILKFGKRKMNSMLIEAVAREKPDLCFFVYSYEIDGKTVKKIRDLGFVTYNWFTDDIWRFDSFSKYYAPLFDFVSTTDEMAFKKYEKMGYNGIIKTQFGCNHFLYRPMKSSKKYGATFVGQSYGERASMIENLIYDGIKVECYGAGWENGRIAQDDMIRVFGNSRININFSASSPSTKIKLRDIAAIALRKEMDKKIYFYNPREWLPRYALLTNRQTRHQIKGRTFEIEGTGGFQLCEYADDLEKYYRLDKEIATFNNKKGLLDNVKYYLENESERKKIARAGYLKTLKEHTYEERFNNIFKEMGLR